MVKRDIIAMAAKNLMRRKGRTFLTMLGVLIGTTSIVVMVSLGIGLQQSQQKMYEQWGSLNEIEVNRSYSHGDDEENIVVLDDDALEYFQSLEGVTAVIPMASISADTVPPPIRFCPSILFIYHICDLRSSQLWIVFLEKEYQ